MSASTRPLPSWANFVPQSNPGETTLGKEEFELRQRAYRCASKRVSNACAHTLGRSIDELIAGPLQRFLLQFQPQRSTHQQQQHQQQQHQQQQHQQQQQQQRRQPEDSVCKKRRRVQNHNKNLKFDNVRNYIDSITYHPSILPIAIIRLSPSETDRSLFVRLLKRRLLLDHCTRVRNVPNEVHTNDSSPPSDSNDYRPVVCVVTDRGFMQKSGKGRGDHGDYLRDILIQCVRQETNPYEFSHLLGRSKKRLGWSKQIVKWASMTTKFNSIVVILENPEAIPRQIFDDLIRTISSFRSDAGLPISLVLCSRCSELVEGRLSTIDAIDGEAGILVNDFEMKPPDTLYVWEHGGYFSIGEFFDNLYAKKQENCFLPFLLPIQTLRRLRNEFVHYHRSVTGLAVQLKMVLSHHFARRGTFLAFANDRSFSRQYGIHIAWFCVDSYARDWIFGKKKHKCNNYQDLLKAVQLSHGACCHNLFIRRLVKITKTFAKQPKEIEWNMDDDEEFKNNSGHLKEWSAAYSSTFEKVYVSIRNYPCQDLMNLLKEWIGTLEEYTTASGHSTIWNFIEDGYSRANEEDEGRESSDVNISTEFLSFLTKAFVMLEITLNDDRFMLSESEKELLHHSIREELAETLHRYIWSVNNDGEGPTVNMPNFHFGRKSQFSLSLSAEPRRKVASSILTESKGSSCVPCNNLHVQDTRIAFSILDTRVVSTEFWFHEFEAFVCHDWEDGENLMKDILNRFAFAVYQLMYCGYIVRSRRGPNFFEKGAMVWTRLEE